MNKIDWSRTSSNHISDDPWVLSLHGINSQEVPCPLCVKADIQGPNREGHIEVYPGIIEAQFSQRQFTANCNNGHEYQAYVRLPDLYLYETDSGIGTPFDTSN